MTGCIGCSKYAVFAEKAGQPRYPRDCKCSGKKHCMGHRNLVFQAAHLSHVLLTGKCMDHTARSKEKQCFKEGMRHKMKDTGTERTDTDTDKHVAELTDRRIRQHSFDVVLNKADGRCIERCKSSHDCYDLKCCRSKHIEEIHPCY